MAKNFFKSKLPIIIVLVVAVIIRIFRLDSVPVSLFGDELDAGYHAYSIAKTGRDYQGNFMPLHFHSLAEWRTPLFIYALVPTVSVFGVTPLGVRIPPMFFGVLGVWGTYLLFNALLNFGRIKEKKSKESPESIFGVLAALIMALSPWHVHYSRAGFEVTMLLSFFIFGLYYFLRSLRRGGKGLWVSIVLFVFTPWIYSTAKLFTPLLLLFLFIVWRKFIFAFDRKEMLKGIVAGLVVGLPIAYSTLFGGGAERAKYTSVFTDPTVEHEVGNFRDHDAAFKDDLVVGRTPKVDEKIFHNKFIIWYEDISGNFFKSLSFDFLFTNGDPYLRHSPKGVGQFYQIEALALILGLVMFFGSNIDSKIKSLIGFWIIFGILPSALTRDGGYHATRLILILPPLVFLIAYGLFSIKDVLNKNYYLLFSGIYLAVFAFNFIFYLHNYFVHYPWDSEKWWHAGYREAISDIKKMESDYDRVIISMSKEPAWIFFAAWYQYDPKSWQENFPVGKGEDVYGFGKMSYIDKFYFGSFSEEGGNLYNLGKYLKPRTLYLANREEISPNLIMEPGRTPPDLELVKAYAYPSGEPVFYLFSKKP